MWSTYIQPRTVDETLELLGSTHRMRIINGGTICSSRSNAKFDRLRSLSMSAEFLLSTKSDSKTERFTLARRDSQSGRRQ
jgi:hypothetical protein